MTIFTIAAIYTITVRYNLFNTHGITPHYETQKIKYTIIIDHRRNKRIIALKINEKQKKFTS